MSTRAGKRDRFFERVHTRETTCSRNQACNFWLFTYEGIARMPFTLRTFQVLPLPPLPLRDSNLLLPPGYLRQVYEPYTTRLHIRSRSRSRSRSRLPLAFIRGVKHETRNDTRCIDRHIHISMRMWIHALIRKLHCKPRAWTVPTASRCQKDDGSCPRSDWLRASTDLIRSRLDSSRLSSRLYTYIVPFSFQFDYSFVAPSISPRVRARSIQFIRPQITKTKTIRLARRTRIRR